MTLRTILTALSAAALLAGCATDRFDRLRDFKSNDEGYAVASVGHGTDSPFIASQIFFRRLGSEDHGAFVFSPKAWGTPKANFKTSDAEGLASVRALPPGDYEVYSVNAVRQEGGAGVRYAPAMRPFSFSVSSGQVVYLGRYILGAPSSFGPPRDVQVNVTDAAKEDLDLVQRDGRRLPADARRVVPAPIGR